MNIFSKEFAKTLITALLLTTVKTIHDYLVIKQRDVSDKIVTDNEK